MFVMAARGIPKMILFMSFLFDGSNLPRPVQK